MKERDKQASQKPVSAGPKAGKDPQIQGEGDYAADRRYRERTDHFLKDADVEEVARAAAPKSDAEAEEMAAAEKQGRAHAHLPAKHANKQGDKSRG